MRRLVLRKISIKLFLITGILLRKLFSRYIPCITRKCMLFYEKYISLSVTS